MSEKDPLTKIQNERAIYNWLFTLPFEIIHQCSHLTEIVDNVSRYYGSLKVEWSDLDWLTNYHRMWINRETHDIEYPQIRNVQEVIQSSSIWYRYQFQLEMFAHGSEFQKMFKNLKLSLVVLPKFPNFAMLLISGFDFSLFKNIPCNDKIYSRVQQPPYIIEDDPQYTLDIRSASRNISFTTLNLLQFKNSLHKHLLIGPKIFEKNNPTVMKEMESIEKMTNKSVANKRLSCFEFQDVKNYVSGCEVVYINHHDKWANSLIDRGVNFTKLDLNIELYTPQYVGNADCTAFMDCKDPHCRRQESIHRRMDISSNLSQAEEKLEIMLDNLKKNLNFFMPNVISCIVLSFLDGDFSIPIRIL